MYYLCDDEMRKRSADLRPTAVVRDQEKEMEAEHVGEEEHEEEEGAGVHAVDASDDVHKARNHEERKQHLQILIIHHMIHINVFAVRTEVCIVVDSGEWEWSGGRTN